MSAPPLHVLLSPASVPEAGLEHMCPCRPAGAQASTGVPTEASTAERSLGGGAAFIPPGPALPEAALMGGGAQAHQNPLGPRRPCGGQYSGPPGPMWPEESMAGAGLRPRPLMARRGFGSGGVQVGPMWPEGCRGGLRPGTCVASRGLGGRTQARDPHSWRGLGVGA